MGFDLRHDSAAAYATWSGNFPTALGDNPLPTEWVISPKAVPGQLRVTGATGSI
jgi:hypothetical protein